MPNGILAQRGTPRFRLVMLMLVIMLVVVATWCIELMIEVTDGGLRQGTLELCYEH